MSRRYVTAARSRFRDPGVACECFIMFSAFKASEMPFGCVQNVSVPSGHEEPVVNSPGHIRYQVVPPRYIYMLSCRRRTLDAQHFVKSLMAFGRTDVRDVRDVKHLDTEHIQRRYKIQTNLTV